jgi:transcriptional regulator with XRE-family HTH domain
VNLREQIGQRIKALREQRGWSQRELGERANMTHSFLSRLERGQTGIEIETLQNLAHALGVGLADLFADDVTPSRPADAGPAYDRWEAVVQSLSATSRELAETLRLQVQEVAAPLARAQEIAQENVRQAFRWAEVQSPHVARHDGGAVAAAEDR